MEAVETIPAVRFLTRAAAEKASGRSLKEEFGLKKISTSHGYKPNLKPIYIERFHETSSNSLIQN